MSRCGLPSSAWLADNRADRDRWISWWTLQRRKLPFGLDRPARRSRFGPAKRWFLPGNEVLLWVCAYLWWVVDAQTGTAGEWGQILQAAADAIAAASARVTAYGPGAPIACSPQGC